MGRQAIGREHRIGGADAGLPPKQCLHAATAAACGYRRRMAEAAAMDPLDLWYRTVQLDDLARLAQFKRRAAAKQLAEVRSSAARKTMSGRSASSPRWSTDGGESVSDRR